MIELLQKFAKMAGRELSGRELREQLQWRHSLDTVAALPQKGGIKDYAPDGSWLQERKLENFYSERRSILQEERVHTRESLGRGEWLSSVGKVRVIKTTGKFWKNFVTVKMGSSGCILKKHCFSWMKDHWKSTGLM